MAQHSCVVQAGRTLTFLFATCIDGFAAAPLVITTTSLPTVYIGRPYSLHLQATGGVPPYNWTGTPFAAFGVNGLTLSPGGDLTGTPSLQATTVSTQVGFSVTDTAGGFASVSMPGLFTYPPQLNTLNNTVLTAGKPVELAVLL